MVFENFEIEENLIFWLYLVAEEKTTEINISQVAKENGNS